LLDERPLVRANQRWSMRVKKPSETDPDDNLVQRWIQQLQKLKPVAVIVTASTIIVGAGATVEALRQIFKPFEPENPTRILATDSDLCGDFPKVEVSVDWITTASHQGHERLVIKNGGSAPFEVGSVSVDGPVRIDAKSNTCENAVLEPGQQCTADYACLLRDNRTNTIQMMTIRRFGAQPCKALQHATSHLCQI
jgi:hypothetical protein